MAKTNEMNTAAETATRHRRNVAVEGMDLDASKRQASKMAQDAAVCAIMKSSKEYEGVAKAAQALLAALSKCS